MPREEVERTIISRLPTEQPALEVPVEDVGGSPEPDVPEGEDDGGKPEDRTEKPVSPQHPNPRSTGRLFRQTRRKLTHFWLGIDNPPGWFETAVIVTARLFAKEELSQDEATTLLMRYAREIPQEARHCSGRLSKGDWASIDHDIAKAVNNAFRDNGKQPDVERSDRELAKTIAAWSKFGFRLSDKATWSQRGASGDEDITINWNDDDRRYIALWLMPALKIDDPELAVRVTTGIVSLTRAKDAEGKGWGYAYLKQWLPDNFGIKCGKQAKQAAVFKALVDLRIIRVLYKGSKGRATRWALGSRVLARLDREVSHDETSQKTENLGWMVQEPGGWSPWDNLEGEGGERRRREEGVYFFMFP